MSRRFPPASAVLAAAVSVLVVVQVGAAPVLAMGGPTSVGDRGLQADRAASVDEGPAGRELSTDRTAPSAEVAAANDTSGTISTCTVIDTNGTYRLTQNITAPNDATCIFINASDVTFDGNGYTLTANGSGTSAGHPIAVQDSPEFPDFVEGTLSNVTVRNVRTVGWYHPVYFRDVEHGSVVDVIVRDATVEGIQFVGGLNHRVVDSTVVGSGQGVEIRDAPGVRIVRTTTNNNGDQGILLAPARNATIRDSTANGNEAGIYVTSRSDNLTIVNSTIRASRKYGIVVGGLNDGRIVNNTVTGSGFFGIHLVGGEDHVVSDNTVALNFGGIRIEKSPRALVHNNSVLQNKRRGIYVWNADRSVVRENTVVGNETAPYPRFQTGITLRSSDDVTIENNVLSHHTDVGLRALLAAIRFQVTGNVIRDNGHGIELETGVTSGTIERNRIVNNTGSGIFATFDAKAALVDVRDNVIAGNHDYGVHVDYRNDDLILDAEQNWWGDGSGPSSPSGVATSLSDPYTGALANGTGDVVSENGSAPGVSNVHFDPWLGTSPVIGDELTITTDRLARTRLGVFVTHQIETRGGTPPVVSFEVVDGSISPGMELHDDGTLNGTPATAGNFSFTVRVTDSANETATATVDKQVSVSVPPGSVEIEKEGSRAIAGETQLYLIKVENTGDTIARNLSVDEFLEPWFSYETATPEPDRVETRVTFDGVSYGYEENLTRTTLTWNISELQPGETRLLTYQVGIDDRLPVGFTVTGNACVGDGDDPCYDQYGDCRTNLDDECDDGLGDITGGGTALACNPFTGGLFDCLLDQFGPSPSPEDICSKAGVITICNRQFEICRKTQGAQGTGHLRGDCNGDENDVESPGDPNVKLVAAERYIQPDQTLPYAVRFKNVGNAPARNVTVTDTLSADLNRSSLAVYTANRTRRSLEPGETVTLFRRTKNRTRTVTIGNTTVTRNETVTEHYTATLENRTVTWRLENIDLPPNATDLLLLSVAPADGLANGTRIENNATVHFDQVSTLTTNDTVNVIDGVAPSCRVSSLPPRSPRDIALNWTGSDPVGEIGEVWIYASTDGETWELAAIGTGDGVPTFPAEFGETYRFTCVAEDVAGNREVQAPGAEATTTVPSVNVSGAVNEADGRPAANDTVTIADAAQPILPVSVFDRSSTVACGLVVTERVLTDDAGRFSMVSEVTVEKDLAYYQAHASYFRGTNELPPTGARAFPRDGSPDLFGLTRFTPTADTDVGTVDLPPAHVLDITVRAEDGTPVENATVAVTHMGPDGARASVVFPNATNASGVFAPRDAESPGIEVTGDVTVSVVPPENDGRFVPGVSSANLTVASPSRVTLTLDRLDNEPPTVDAGPDVDLDEGDTLNRSGSIVDPDSTGWTGTVDYGDGSGTSPLPIEGAGFDLQHRYVENGSYTVTVNVSDGVDNGTDRVNVTVQNVAPDLSVVHDAPVDEGSVLTLTATIEDPGIEDTHTLSVEWGDGNTTTVTVDQAAATNTTSVQHTYIDDGAYPVNVTVRDDDGGEETVSTTVSVQNVPPTVEATGATIDEGETATITGTVTDAGPADTHTATVNWSSGPTRPVAVDQRRGGGSLADSHGYGDNGFFDVVVTVTDDDGGVGRATVTVTVRNLPPTVTLETGEQVALAETDAFLGRAGQSQTHTATATDPGSDDLSVAWTNGPTTTYYNDGTGPDPPASPAGTYPFVVTDTLNVTFGTPGVYELAVTVTDDDGAATTTNATKVVTGDADEVRSMGFWRHQYSQQGQPHHSRENLTAFLAVTDVGSAVFGEEVPVGSFDAAHDTLAASGPSMRDKAEAQALAAWLNFASGRVGWTERIDVDGDGVGDRAFHDVIGEVESILLDGNANRTTLEQAKDLAEAINHHGDEGTGRDEKAGGGDDADGEPTGGDEGDGGRRERG